MSSMAGENIPFVPNFDFETFMKSIGRWPRPVVQRKILPELPQRPGWKSISDGFSYDSEAPKMCDGSRVVVNSEKGANSYFGAVALLIYGDAKYWFWVRIQHLQYFEQVIEAKHSHIRTDLYTRFSKETSGPNFFTLQQRMSYANCWVDHSYIQQITADLYDIYLTVFHYHSGNAAHSLSGKFDGIQRRGSPLSPGKFLLYIDNRHYQPYVQPPEYVDPDRMDVRTRMPYPDITIPMPIILPAPISNLVLKDTDGYLSRVLWVDFLGAERTQLPRQQSQSPVSVQNSGFHAPKKQVAGRNIHNGSSRSEGLYISPDTSPVSSPSGWNPSGFPNTTSLLSPPRQNLLERRQGSQNTVGEQADFSSSHSLHNVEEPTAISTVTRVPARSRRYAQMKIADLERMIAERKIKIPANVSGEIGTMKRKRLYSQYLEAADLDDQNEGMRLSVVMDLAEGPRTITSTTVSPMTSEREERHGSVLRQITTKTTTTIVTSVPRDWVPAQKHDNPLPRDGIEFQRLDEKDLVQLLLGANLIVSGDRDTDIEKYREWRRLFYQERKRAETQRHSEQSKYSTGLSASGFAPVNSQMVALAEAKSESEVEDEASTAFSAPPEEGESMEPGDETEAVSESEVEMEADSEQEPNQGEYLSSPEPLSPEPINYVGWSAAALKRDAAARDPPIRIPTKEKSSITRSTLPQKLIALDQEAREGRNQVREQKRARAELRRLAAFEHQNVEDDGERPAKRTKCAAKNGDDEEEDHEMGLYESEQEESYMEVETPLHD